MPEVPPVEPPPEVPAEDVAMLDQEAEPPTADMTGQETEAPPGPTGHHDSYEEYNLLAKFQVCLPPDDLEMLSGPSRHDIYIDYSAQAPMSPNLEEEPPMLDDLPMFPPFMPHFPDLDPAGPPVLTAPTAFPSSKPELHETIPAPDAPTAVPPFITSPAPVRTASPGPVISPSTPPAASQSQILFPSFKSAPSPAFSSSGIGLTASAVGGSPPGTDPLSGILKMQTKDGKFSINDVRRTTGTSLFTFTSNCSILIIFSLMCISWLLSL